MSAIPGRLLVAFHTPDIALATKITLEHHGYAVSLAATGAEVVASVRHGEVDLLLLDLALPDASGFEVLRTLRSEGPQIPVIVVSAANDEITRTAAFRVGADDFVGHPFPVLELLARINLRLLSGHPPNTTPENLRIDSARQTVTWRGRQVVLTKIEFDLLLTLVRANGAVLSRPQLLRSVWRAPATMHTRTVEFHISSVRKKLAAAGVPFGIRTVRGRGFAWTDADLDTQGR